MSWLKGGLPFSWNEADGMIPMNIGAMLDDGNPDPQQPSGPVATRLSGDYPVVVLGFFNQAQQLIPQPVLQAGQWQGYVQVHNQRTVPTAFMIGLSAKEPDGTETNGNTNGCTLNPAAAAPPTPPPIHPPTPPPSSGHTITVLYDGKVVSQVQV